MDISDRDLDALLVLAIDRYVSQRPRSTELDQQARAHMPGGNTRSVLHFDPFPFRVASASGAQVTDVDGLTYTDYCGNYTAGLLGHSSASVRAAVTEAMDRGFAIGGTHEREIELARLICQRYASVDQVRFTNSGTEANLMAIGTALHHTQRTGVGVFTEAYHGGVLSMGHGGSPLNVPYRFVMAEFNDPDGLDALFADQDLGCVVIEAVQGSGGCRPADPSFLTELQRRCDESGTVLILDEVMTSRLAPGGAQELFGLTPGLTTLGKYLGGGMSFGAFGGSRDIMANFDDRHGGTLTQAGTFNNNVASMAAAVATLTHELDDARIIDLNQRGDRFRADLNTALQDAGLPLHATGLGSMICVRGDDRWVELLFHALLDRGHYIARRGFIALSFCITDQDIETLLADLTTWAATLP